MHRQQFMMKSARPAVFQPKNQERNKAEEFVRNKMSNDPRPFDDNSNASNKRSSLDEAWNDEECYSSSRHNDEYRNVDFPEFSDIHLARNEHGTINSNINDEAYENSLEGEDEETSPGSWGEDRSNHSYGEDQGEQIEGSYCSENENESHYSSSRSDHSQGTDHGSQYDDEFADTHDENGLYDNNDESDVEDNPSLVSDDDGDQEYVSSDQDDARSYVTDGQDQYNSNGSGGEREDLSQGSGDQEDDRSYISDDHFDHHSNGVRDREDRSSFSDDLEEDEEARSYISGDQFDSHSNESHDQEDRSSCSGGQDDDRTFDRSSCSDKMGDDEGDPSYISIGQQEKRSYGSCEEGDPSYISIGQQEKRSYGSCEEEDPSNFSRDPRDDHSFASNDQDEHSSFANSDHEEDRSCYTEDQDEDLSNVSSDPEVDDSYRSGDQEDHHSYYSGDQADDHAYVRQVDDPDVDGDNSYRSGDEEEDLSHNSGDMEDPSYISGSHGDERSYVSGDQVERSCSDVEQDENSSNISDNQEERSNYSVEEEHSDENDDRLYHSIGRDDDSKYNESYCSNGISHENHSTVSIPAIELGDDGDSDDDRKRYHGGTRNSNHYYEPLQEQFSDSGHYADENSYGLGDDLETCNSSTLNDFDSFAHEASLHSMKHLSADEDLRIGDAVECKDDVEDVSVLSSLPANTYATAKVNRLRSERSTSTTLKGPKISKNTNTAQPSALYAGIGMLNPLDESSVASTVPSTKSRGSGDDGPATRIVRHDSESKDSSFQTKQHAESMSAAYEGQQSNDDSYSHSQGLEKDESELSFGGSGSFAGDETLESQQLVTDKSKTIVSLMPKDNTTESSGNALDDDNSNKKSCSDDVAAAKPEIHAANEAPGSSLRLSKPKVYGGYAREQISRLIGREKSADLVRFKKRKDLRGQGKSDSLIEFATNVHGAVVNAEPIQAADTKGNPVDSAILLTSSRLLLAFEALTGIFLQLSDELELLQTFANGKVSPAIEMLESVLAFSKPLDDIFKTLQPILLHHLTNEIDEELDDFLYGMNLILDLLCDLSHRVGEKQIWNARANNSFVTLLELLTRDTLEVSCIYEDVDTPEYELTDLIHDAWEATGHVEELKTLLATDDLFMFRQICYEVILSTDQWCPDINILMDICGIENTADNEKRKPDDDEFLSPPPEAALQILEKIKGDPLPRTAAVASILRRLLPPHAITDPSISESFARIRNTIRNPVGVPPSSLVTITSIPESWDDQDALGVAGVGKSTLAAMVASHDDIRRFYNDGIAWIYVGEIDLNYSRYVQCLQDLLLQLDVDDDEEPLFPELLHIPGESAAMRKRREEGFMIYLRETIVEFLRFRNVLIILDDVCFEPDLDWFDFAPAPPEDDEDEDDEGSCAILITSRRRNLLPPADTVEVDMLDDAEGIELLMNESGELAKVINADANETKSVVRECACHPLTIKSVGRWLNLKHAAIESLENAENMQEDVIKSMDKILKSELQNGTDMMYEILSMSLSPTINGEPTTIIKLCFTAFVRLFCDRKHISDFALADSTPIVPMASTELIFESLLNLEKDTLLQEGSLFHEQKKEAAKLIPDALASLGVLKLIVTYTEAPEDSSQDEVEDEKYLQIMHRIQQEYGEYLYEEDITLTELTKDGERRWNKAFAKAFMMKDVQWDTQAPDAGMDYALEMLPSHMMRGGLLMDAGKILRNEQFIRGRLSVLGRENGSRRHIKDCELLFDLMLSKRGKDPKKMDPKGILRSAYEMLGGLLKMGEDEFIEEEGSPEAVEIGRCHYEIGFSLAERRCWEGAISHWELSQELLVSSLGMVELVAGLLYNIAVVSTEIHEYDAALGSLKQCLRIRGAIHGEEHILYAQTIQKIGDVFLAMSDYHEAMESYDWALDVMHIEPSHHRISIGDALEHIGKIHYSKGEIEESLQSYQDALRSKQIDLGEDHPELAHIYHQIGNCLSNLGRTDEAMAHLEEAIRLKKLDSSGGYERDSDVLTIEGILNNLNCKQKEGLECYEKALQILVTKVPHRKEKVAALLHLIGCVYLMSGEHKKALKLFEESLYARRRVLGFVHLDVASTLFNMAFLHQSRNRLEKALKCLEEALKIRQLRLPDSEKVAVTHEKIGSLARGIGKTKKAENAFTEALRIRKLIHGNSHEAVATVLQELGDLMDDLGEYESAMKHYVEALEIRENRLGPDDLAVAETYYSMGFTLQNNGALDRALQCLEESLSIRKFQLGDDAKDVGDTLNMMGFLQAKRGEHDDALSLLWDALRIRKLQNDNVKVSETLNNIGNVHREKQEYDLSIECYEECLRIRRAELGDEHEKVADVLIALGNVQSDMEYNEEAMDSYKEALAIRNMIFGEQDESVAAVLQFMGTLEFRTNELDRAFQLLDEFIRIRQDNGTEPDGDYVNVLFMIGNIHKMQGYEEDAKKCWTEAYGVFKSLGLAETNPQIAEVMSNLVKEDGMESTATDHLAGLEKTTKNVLGRITANVKRVARSANEAGKAVKKVTGIKSKDRGNQLL